MAKVPNAVEILPKIWTACRRFKFSAHEGYRRQTDRRQTDDRRTGDSIKRTSFAKTTKPRREQLQSLSNAQNNNHQNDFCKRRARSNRPLDKLPRLSQSRHSW